MEDNKDTPFYKTYREIKDHFGFLFRRGYRVISFILGSRQGEGWQITIMRDEYLIKLYIEQRKIKLALTTLQLYDKNVLFDLEDIAHDLVGNRGFFRDSKKYPMVESHQFKRIAWFLERYLELILARVRESEYLIVQRQLLADIAVKNRRWSNDHRLIIYPQPEG